MDSAEDGGGVKLDPPDALVDTPIHSTGMISTCSRASTTDAAQRCDSIGTLTSWQLLARQVGSGEDEDDEIPARKEASAVPEELLCSPAAPHGPVAAGFRRARTTHCTRSTGFWKPSGRAPLGLSASLCAGLMGRSWWPKRFHRARLRWQQPSSGRPSWMRCAPSTCCSACVSSSAGCHVAISPACDIGQHARTRRHGPTRRLSVFPLPSVLTSCRSMCLPA